MLKLLKTNPDTAFFISVAIICTATIAFLSLAIIIPIVLVVLIVWGIFKFYQLPKTQAPLSELYEAALIQFRHIPSVEVAADKFASDLIDRHEGDWPLTTIAGAFVDAEIDLYSAEDFGRLPSPPETTDPIAVARYRELAHAKLKQAEHCTDFSSALQDAFFNVSRKLPPMARFSTNEDRVRANAKGGVMVALSDLIADPTLIEELFQPIFSETNVSAGLFTELRAIIDRNLHEMSGEPWDERARPEKLIPPRKFKGSFAEAVAGYLKDTPFIRIFEQRIPFNLPQKIRFEHHWIVAGTGHGKTQTLQTLILDDLKQVSVGKASVVVIDSQGELINNVARLKLFAPGQPLHDKLCLIDPTDIDYPVALNLFDIGIKRMASYSPLDRERLLNSAIEVLEFILSSLLGAEMTSRQSTLFRYTIQAMLVIPDATIHTFRELMQPGGYAKYREHLQKLDGTAHEFFETQFNAKLFDQTKLQVVARLFTICENRTFERIFASQVTKLNLFDEINAGKVILINTAKDLLKQTGVEVFGRFFIALLTQAAQERATLAANDRLPTFVYIDEAQDYIASDANIAVILEQARKQNIGLIVAHQFLGQLSSATLDSLYANTSIKFAGGVGDRDAHALARNMRAKPELLERQPRGCYAAYVRNFTEAAVSLQFPDRLLEGQPIMSDTEFAQLRDHVRAKYATAHGAPRPAAASPDKPRPAATEPAASETASSDDDWRS